MLFSQNCFVNNTKHCIVFTKKKFFFTVCYFHEIFWFVIYTGNGIRLGFSSTTTTSCFSHQAELRSCSSIRCRTCCCSWRRGRPGGSSRWWRWWPRQQSTRPSSILSSRRAWLHSRDCALLRLFEENLKLHLWKPLELVCILYNVYICSTTTRGCLTSLAAPIALYVLPFLLLHRSAPPPGLRLFFPLFFLWFKPSGTGPWWFFRKKFVKSLFSHKHKKNIY